jgi:hypothetical protein
LVKTRKLFWSIPNAARRIGYSSRHFRRIIEQHHIPIIQIKGKFFILADELDKWESMHGIPLSPAA